MIPEEAHSRFMQRSLELAALGRGLVSPNPLVGCVIVHSGKIIAEGYHRKYGGPHAEVNAIQSCSSPELFSESTLYVSLEPCSHHGKTPPCANLIVEKGIKTVVVAMQDPNPLVSGRGIQLLREAGVSVHLGVLEKESRELNKVFIWAQENQRPYVYIKWAESKDGFVDLHRTSSEKKAAKISDNKTNVLSHELRAQVDGILVGRRTFELDRPSLNVRLSAGKNPMRIILDPSLSISEQYIHSYDSKALIINNFKKSETPDVSKLKLENWNNTHELLGLIFKRGIHSILVEGGTQTINWFLQTENWNELRRIQSSEVVLNDGVAAPEIASNAILKSSFKSGSDLVEDYLPRPKPLGSPN